MGGIKVGSERDGNSHGDLQTGDRHRESHPCPPGNPPHESTKLRLGISVSSVRCAALKGGEHIGHHGAIAGCELKQDQALLGLAPCGLKRPHSSGDVAFDGQQ